MTAGPQPTKPIVIAHRGACGYLPEHTLAAYATAVFQGADFIEPDLVMTRDGRLIARHDNRLDETTDVARRPEFASRRTTRAVDGRHLTGWFSEDFTLAEIRTLRVVERLPQLRPANARFDGQFQIPTLEEILGLREALERVVGRPIGLYPETKHPTHFRERDLPMEERLVQTLHAHGLADRGKVYIQSFEVANLQHLRRLTRIPLIQLLAPQGQPFDMAAAGSGLTYARMATSAGLKDIAAYADGVGPDKSLLIPRDANGRLDPGCATAFVADAHHAGLEVHPYTFRAENGFLPLNQRRGDDPAARGDLSAELTAFLDLGIDGFFTDHPDLGVQIRDAAPSLP